jgi:hypothetical protein
LNNESLQLITIEPTHIIYGKTFFCNVLKYS